MSNIEQIDVKSWIPQVHDILAAHPEIVLAYLHGSAANESMTPLSDIDIALVIDETRLAKKDRLDFELTIAGEISLRVNFYEIDARIINTAPIMFKGEVVTNGLLIFSHDEDARVEFETRTRSEYFDFKPTAEFLREAFFEDVRQRGLDGQRAQS